MIIGSVGSGKSSLVSAMQGEMTTLSGSVQFSRSVKTSTLGFVGMAKLIHMYSSYRHVADTSRLSPI